MVSLSTVETILHAVNDVTPLGLVVLLTGIVYLLVAKRGPIQAIKNNHLHHVQESLERIADTSDKQLDVLNDLRDDISWVKGRLS